VIPTKWIPVLLDFNRAAEFADDDVDQFSAVCDLGGNFEFVTVICPIMDSSHVTVYVQRIAAIDEVPAVLHALDADTAGSFIQTISDVSTVAITGTFRIGGAQYLRLRTSHNQDQDITFYCRGFNRG